MPGTRVLFIWECPLDSSMWPLEKDDPCLEVTKKLINSLMFRWDRKMVSMMGGDYCIGDPVHVFWHWSWLLPYLHLWRFEPVWKVGLLKGTTIYLLHHAKFKFYPKVINLGDFVWRSSLFPCLLAAALLTQKLMQNPDMTAVHVRSCKIKKITWTGLSKPSCLMDDQFYHTR